MTTPGGKLIYRYEVSGDVARTKGIRFHAIASVVFIALLVLSFWQGLAANSTFLAAMFVIGLIGAVPMLIANIYRGYYRQERTVEIYEGGFVVHEKGSARVRLDNTTSYSWSDLQSYRHAVTKRYYNGVYTGTTYALILVANDNKKVVISGQYRKQPEPIVELLPRLTFVPLMNRALTELQTDKSVTFGKIIVTSNGIEMGGKSLDWKDVASVNAAKGRLVIRARTPNGKSRTFAGTLFAILPNGFVLLELANRLIAANRSKI